jgi:hypothetical protein
MADKTDNEETADKAATAKAETSAKRDDATDDADEDSADEAEAKEAKAEAKPAPKVEAKKPAEAKPKAAGKKAEPAKSDATKSDVAKKSERPGLKKPSTPKADKVKETKRDGDDAKNVSRAAEPPKAVHIGGESLVDRIVPHLKKIMVGAIVLAVVLTGVFAVKWWRERKREKATEGIAVVLDLANRPIVAKPDPNDKTPSFPSVKDRATAVLSALDNEGVDLGHAFRAGQLLDSGQIDAAIAEYQAGRTTDGIEGVLCRENLGIAQETKVATADPATKQKGLEEALETFKTMQPDPQGPRHAYALYHQGRVNIELTRYPEGKELLEKARALAGNTDLADLIARSMERLPQ